MLRATKKITTRLERVVAALKENGIETNVAKNSHEAKEKILAMIPQGAEVMTMTSVTLDALGIPEIINESGNYISVKSKLNQLDRDTQDLEMRKLGSAPQWAIGSVHAVTEDGQVLIASNTGSQLPAYAYGAQHVLWVVGIQKIVKNLDDGMNRIYDYVLPLESERLNAAYNISTGSYVSKVLIVNKEIKPGRVHLLLVEEPLGF